LFPSTGLFLGPFAKDYAKMSGKAKGSLEGLGKSLVFWGLFAYKRRH
jgi:hypothetical protein